MPNALIEKVAKVGKLSKEQTEHLWNKAKHIAEENGFKLGKSGEDDNRFYAYTVGIFKHMITKKTTEKLKWNFPERWTQKASAGLLNSIEINTATTSTSNMFDTYAPIYSEADSSLVDPMKTIVNPLKMFSNSSFSLGQTHEVIHVSDTDLVKTQQIKLADVGEDTGNNTRVETPIDAGFWLPLAAPYYGISKNLNDYVLMTVPAMISSIPNTNGDSISLSELLDFSTTAGMPAYRTFRGKPCYSEHNSADMKQAKGVILDVFLRPLKGFANNKHAKLIQLLAFDKTKDPELCRKIDSGEANTVSIGIYYQSYSCSLCGNTVSPSAGKPCSHTYLKCRTYQDKDTGRLVYRHCHKMFAFETSVVADPAYVSAIGSILRP